jgi:hypothetical protein
LNPWPFVSFVTEKIGGTMTTVKKYIEEGLLGMDFQHDDGVEFLQAFAPGVHFPEANYDVVESDTEIEDHHSNFAEVWEEPSRQWSYWKQLLEQCAASSEQYSDEVLPVDSDDWGEREYAIFEKILRGGFCRWMVQHGGKWHRGRYEGVSSGFEVPNVFMYAVGELARLKRGQQRKTGFTGTGKDDEH